MFYKACAGSSLVKLLLIDLKGPSDNSGFHAPKRVFYNNSIFKAEKKLLTEEEELIRKNHFGSCFRITLLYQAFFNFYVLKLSWN